jgi:hypothetical protein
VTVKDAGVGRASGGENEKQYQAIELSITATNPSTRNVYLLSNYWRVMGVPIVTRAMGSDWVDNANTLIEQQMPPANAGTHYEAKRDVLVAAGSVFNDDILRPSESISASFVFYVPQGIYAVLNVDEDLPSVATRNSVRVVHKLTPDGKIESRAYRIEGDGTLGAEITDYLAAGRDPTIQMQAAYASRQLSLWRKTEEGSAEAKSQ